MAQVSRYWGGGGVGFEGVVDPKYCDQNGFWYLTKTCVIIIIIVIWASGLLVSVL